MKNTWLARCDLLNASIHAIGLVALLFASPLLLLADIAVLREKGPFSGSAFSNPGVVGKENAQLKVAMSTATVNIHLKRGEGDLLTADCTAEFVLWNQADKSIGDQEFLAAFPITGMNSKKVSVSHFTVEVDGVKPAAVFRRHLSVSKWEATLVDAPLFGILPEKFAPPKNTKISFHNWQQSYVQLADETFYANAYVWVQKTSPETESRVKVTYSVNLKPQQIRYSKSYNNSPDDSEVIPFADLHVKDWDRQYYFFDYILRSGSTWYGPIKKETITLNIDPQLGLKPSDVNSGTRHPASFRPNEWQKSEAAYDEGEYQQNSLTWTITGEPYADLLIAIPATAAQNAASAPGK